MKKLLISLLVFFNAILLQSHAQVTNLYVETYYISDSNDAADLDGGNGVPGVYLETGSKTYRVYVELEPGSKLIKIYGDTNHVLRIESTAHFFNNFDRGESFGKDIPQNRINNNTVALDTWLTLGLATKIHAGVLKTEDADSSFVGGDNNDGGSQGDPLGLLRNNDPLAGIPITTADGLMPDTITGIWSASGDLYDAAPDTTIFGTDTSKTAFISNDAYLQQNDGVAGVLPGSNKVLVAQLTTKGELTLQLNVEVETSTGAIVDYVSQLAPGEVNTSTLQVSPFLSYPTACGCRDPHYIEYGSQYACDNVDSCKHLVVYGCMDTMACNYDPTANFNIASLCCYPGYCNDRDIAAVCPALANQRVRLFPNPVQDQLNMEITGESGKELKYEIVNTFGRVVEEHRVGSISDRVNLSVNIKNLNAGLYLIRLYMGGDLYSRSFMKN